MKAHWIAFGVGIAIGAALGYWMGGKSSTGASNLPAGAGITGGFAAPFQAKIQGINR